MKNILFVMKYPIEEKYSIKQKLDGEMAAVSKLGYGVYFISFDKKYLYLNHGLSKEIICKTTFGKSKAYYHLISFYDIYKAARKVINENDIDYVYFRYGPLNLKGYQFFKTAYSKSKLIVEIPTFPLGREKQKTTMRRLYMKFSEGWWRRASKYISLFTIIGEKADSYLGVPALNIDNAVAVENIPFRNPIKPSDAKIHILAVASMCKWHGYDRIIKSLSNLQFPNRSEFILDLVGDEGDGSLNDWKKLVADSGLQDQVIFHGKMTGESLTHMFEIATIGLCSLAMSRTNFYSGSVLKLREYMARGLPFVYAHDDPDIFPEMPWCLKIDNNEEPVDMNLVLDFIRRVKDDPEVSSSMRKYASENMTWEVQFKKVFTKLEGLNDGRT